MYVEITRRHEDGRPVTTRLKHHECDEALEFHPTTGKAQCTQAVGEHYINAYPGVVVESGTESSSATDSDDVTDESSDADTEVETDGGEPEFFAAVPDDDDEQTDETDAASDGETDESDDQD